MFNECWLFPPEKPGEKFKEYYLVTFTIYSSISILHHTNILYIVLDSAKTYNSFRYIVNLSKCKLWFGPEIIVINQ